ncbi:outer membrane protein TolC [Chitinophaga polysaccharea]|uniref:Outer membrane protein TolC n=1 Tax=Chitinophaga polysaccharea TaxID=1293035 RepID=A0A561PAU7_9BACT|nr:TolC family protein [Chitinophaga polysaccharea]TWF35263.1 outer membrane protein TolC [Chitinophaga polysaccharea]
MKTGIIFLLLAAQIRVAAGQTMPEKDTGQPATTLSLQQCLDYASAHNQELLVKAQSADAATQDRKAAAAALLPDITITAAVNNYWKIPVQVFPGELVGRPPGTFVPVRMGTPWMGNYGAEASLLLVDVKTWQNIRLAKLQQQAANSEYHSLQRLLRKNVRMAYYSAQLQQDYLAVTQQLYSNYQQIHDLVLLQFNKGLTDKIAFNQSAALLKNRQLAVQQATASLQEAWLDLKFWMGFPPDSLLHTQSADPLPPLDIPNYNATQLPDYEAEQLKVSIAAQQYRHIQASLYPSLHLKGSYQQLGFGDQINFVTRSPWFTVGFAGVELRFPLSWSNISAKPRSMKAQWQASSSRFKQYEAAQEKKYRQEKLLLEKAAGDIQVLKENIALAQENETLSRQKINKGIIDMIQLKEIQQDLYDAEVKLNDARTDFFKHYTELNYLQHQ